MGDDTPRPHPRGERGKGSTSHGELRDVRAPPPPIAPTTTRSATQTRPLTSPPPAHRNHPHDIDAANKPNNHPETRNPNKRKRLKIAIACNGCRDKKLKCDGARPACSTCVRKGIVDECVYDEVRGKGMFTQAYVANLKERIDELEARLRGRSEEKSSTPDNEAPPTSVDPIQPSSSVGFTLSVPSVTHGYPVSYVRNEPALTPPTLHLSVPTPLPSASVLTHGHDGKSPHTEEIDAMGAIIDGADSNCQNSPFPGTRDVEKDGFYGGSSVASFMKEIRSSSSSGRPTQRKQRPPTMVSSSANLQSFNIRSTRLGSQDFAARRPQLPLVPTLAEMYVLPPRTLADHLITCYWDNVHVMYPFFHGPSFMSQYETLWSGSNHGARDITDDPIQGIFYGCVNAMFAMGCKFSPSMTLEEREANAEVFIDRIKLLIRIEIIDAGSLELVQMMLVMGQVMQSTTAANRCWNAFGMAIRVAQGLGIHLEGNVARDPDPVRRELKRRVWHGCVIFDRILAMTLGRPCAIRKNHVSLPQSAEISSPSSSSPKTISGTQPPEYAYYQLQIKLFSILGDILCKVYEPLTDDTGLIATGPSISKITQCSSSIVELDATLLEFWNNVPTEFLTDSQHDNPILKRQTVTLRASYLHLRIFLFRPLLSILTTKPALVKESNMMHSYIFLHGSTYCLHSALELIELIYANYSSGSVPAWWYNVLYIYTAAAVLIAASHRFHHFKTETTTEQIAASVGKAKEILQMLQGVSSAARACLHILEGFDQNNANGANSLHSTTAAGASSIDSRDATPNPRSPQHHHHHTMVDGSEATALESYPEQRVDDPAPKHTDVQHGVVGFGGIQIDRFENVQEGMGMYTWPLDAGAGTQEFLLPSFEWLMASGDIDAEAGMWQC